MSLDTAVAQMTFRARQIERALHDPGLWSVAVGQYDIPARRVIGDDHVTFYAVLPLWEDQALPGLGYIHAELRCDGCLVAVKNLAAIDDLAEVAWEFLVIDPEQVAA